MGDSSDDESLANEIEQMLESDVDTEMRGIHIDAQRRAPDPSSVPVHSNTHAYPNPHPHLHADAARPQTGLKTYKGLRRRNNSSSGSSSSGSASSSGSSDSDSSDDNTAKNPARKGPRPQSLMSYVAQPRSLASAPLAHSSTLPNSSIPAAAPAYSASNTLSTMLSLEADLKNQKDAAAKEIAGLKSTVSRLQADLRKSADEKANLSAKVASFQSENSKLHSQLKALQQSTASPSTATSSDTLQNNRTQKKAIADLQATIKDLQADNKRAKADAVRDRSELKEKLHQAHSREREALNLREKEESADREKAMDLLRAKLKEAEAERDRAVSSSSFGAKDLDKNVLAENARLIEEANELRRRLAESPSRGDDRQELNTLSGKYAQVKEDLVIARKEIRQLTESNHRLSLELERLNAELMTGEKDHPMMEVRSSHSNDSSCEESVASMTRQIMVLQRTVMQLEKEKLVLQDALTRHLVERYEMESTRVTQQSSDENEDGAVASNGLGTAAGNGISSTALQSSGISNASSNNGMLPIPANSSLTSNGTAPISPQLTNSSTNSSKLVSGTSIGPPAIPTHSNSTSLPGSNFIGPAGANTGRPSASVNGNSNASNGGSKSNEYTGSGGFSSSTAQGAIGKAKRRSSDDSKTAEAPLKLSPSSKSRNAANADLPPVNTNVKRTLPDSVKDATLRKVSSPSDSVASGGSRAGASTLKRTRTDPLVPSGLRDDKPKPSRYSGNNASNESRDSRDSRDSPQLPPMKRSKLQSAEASRKQAPSSSSVPTDRLNTSSSAINTKISNMVKHSRNHNSESSLLKPPATESGALSSASSSPSLSQNLPSQQPPLQSVKIRTLTSYLSSRDSPTITSNTSPSLASASSSGSLTSLNNNNNTATNQTNSNKPVTAKPPRGSPLGAKGLAAWIIKAQFGSRENSDSIADSVLSVSNDPITYGSGRGIEFLMREVLFEVWKGRAPEDGAVAVTGGRYSKSAASAALAANAAANGEKAAWEWCDLKKDVEDGEEIETVRVPSRTGGSRLEEGIPKEERNCIWFIWTLSCAVQETLPNFVNDILEWVEKVAIGSEGRNMDLAMLCRLTRFYSSFARLTSNPSDFMRIHKLTHSILVAFSSKPRKSVAVIDGIAGCWPEAFKFRPRGDTGNDADGYREVAFMMETCCVLMMHMVDELTASGTAVAANMCQFAMRGINKSWPSNRKNESYMDMLLKHLCRLFYYPDEAIPMSNVVIESLVLTALHMQDSVAVEFVTQCIADCKNLVAAGAASSSKNCAANFVQFMKRLFRGLEKRGGSVVEMAGGVLEFVGKLGESAVAGDTADAAEWQFVAQIVGVVVKSSGAGKMSVDLKRLVGAWVRKMDEGGKAVPVGLKDYGKY
ncbi:hypothetical protein HDU80_006964 [Chytriomyces hyalinus]|nr:hypothetical protein HDU80_006964 [Chytriomyces hyalinus]